MGGEGEFVVEEELGWCHGGRQSLGERGAPGIWSIPKCEPLFQRSSGAEQNGQSRARKLGSGRVRRSHIPGSRSRRRRRTLGTSAMLAGAPTGAPGAGCSGMRSSGGTSGTRTGGGTRTATSRGAKAAPGKSGRRGRRLAGGATAVGKMCPPGEADPGSPIPGTGSAALAETPAAAELWVSIWGKGGPEPAQTCSKLPGCHGWTIPLGASPCLSSCPGPGLSTLPVLLAGTGVCPSTGEGVKRWRLGAAGCSPSLNPWDSVPLLRWGERLLGVLSGPMGWVWALCPPGISWIPQWICRAVPLCWGDLLWICLKVS